MPSSIILTVEAIAMDCARRTAKVARWWMLFTVLAVVPSQALQGRTLGSPATGNGFLVLCDANDAASQAACGGYTMGMIHMLMAVTVNGQARKVACPPGTATATQIKDYLLAYLRVHPDLRHLATAQLYMSAIAEAFPCPPETPLPPANKRF